MVWRSRTTPTDRFFACLVYLLPLAEAYLLGGLLLSWIAALIPPIAPLMVILSFPLQLISELYLLILRPFQFGSFGLGGFLIFVLLFALVVRNEQICHFVRFNTMQSIMIGIALSLFSVLWSLVTQIIPVFAILTLPLAGGLLLGTLALCGYSIFQSIVGKYAEIPTISDAAYVRVQ